MSKFQLLLPSFNGSKTLPWTLRTLEDQNDDDITFLLSNNCSTDETEEIMRDFARRDKRFKIISTEKTLSLRDSVEFIMAAATGEFIMLIGGDDALYDGCLRVAKEALRQHPEALALTHRASLFLWPQVAEEVCDEKLHPGGLRIGAANTFELRDARADLRAQALGMIHSPMPAPYSGWVSMSLIERIKKKMGRVFHHHVTDYWFASATCAEMEDAKYVRCGLPLCLSAYSADSTALTFFGNSDSRVGDAKVKMEASIEGQDLCFLTRSVRGYRYEILKLVLQHWNTAPYTKRELDLNYLPGFWEEWKQRIAEGDKRMHAAAGSAATLRAVVDQLAQDTGLTDFITDLDKSYVLRGDNSALWERWGTSFQMDRDWSHDLCIDTRKLGCQNVHDASKIVSSLVQALMQAGEAYAKLLAGTPLAGGPSAAVFPDLAHAGYAAIQQAHEASLNRSTKALQKSGAQASKKLRKINQWKSEDDAPWALRTGLKLARFLGKATGRLPK